MNEKIDVLAVIDDMTNSILRPNGGAYVEQMELVRTLIADLIEAARHWNRWDYEVMSAKVNGESVYSFNELSAMREFARGLTESTLSKIGGA